MKRKKRLVVRIFVTLIIVLVAGVVSSFILIQIAPKPPVKEIGKAREAISAARSVNAHIYDPEQFRRAERLYDSAVLLWKFQNQEFFLKRNFDKCQTYAILAETNAILAGDHAVEKSTNLQKTLRADIDKLRSEVKDFKQIFDRLPIGDDISKKYEKGKLLLAESEVNYQEGNYLISLEKLTQSKELINKAMTYTNNMVSNYFSNYSTWVKWADQTISLSKRNQSTAILVDKFSGKCYVYKNGALKYTFPAEVGKNWVGTKRYKGDKATPEGFYTITKKKSNHQTKYYKALLLNYPNGEDKQRFSRDVKEGRISRSAQIGGMIEIHGGGGRGANWTDGCIALTNKDMDVIFNVVSEGTPVTIIGSLVGLKEAFE
ncbi:MAG TPA: L,D-transpeptidase family protein [Bacteroidales bacterium]|nr:L,D-transpeptidase family protein [Bacteroidales bacterium]